MSPGIGNSTCKGPGVRESMVNERHAGGLVWLVHRGHNGAQGEVGMGRQQGPHTGHHFKGCNGGQ